MTDRRLPLAIVTGASSGIGREIASLLAKRRYRTLLVARRRTLLESLAKELNPLAPSLPVVMDLGQTDPEPIVSRLIQEHGPVDVLINNAGYGRYRRFVDQTSQEHRRLLEVNYFATAAMIRAVLPTMLRRRRGSVINIASMAAKMGAWGHGAYGAAKAGVVCLTQALAAEHAGSGVHFSYVCPGLVATEFFDDPSFVGLAPQLVKRAVTARQVAQQTVSLLDRPRLEVVVPRSYRVLDWFSAFSLPLAHWMTTRQSRPMPIIPEKPRAKPTARHKAAN